MKKVNSCDLKLELNQEERTYTWTVHGKSVSGDMCDDEMWYKLWELCHVNNFDCDFDYCLVANKIKCAESNCKSIVMENNNKLLF